MALMSGMYKAHVNKHWFTTSQANTAGLAVRVAIIDPLDDFDERPMMTGTIWFSPKAMGMARSQLKALGFDCDKNDLAEIGDTISFVGVEVDVQLKEEDYKGRVSLKIARFGGVALPPSPKALADATAALRVVKKVAGATDAYSAPEPPKAKPEAPVVSTPEGEDEIPF